MTFKISTKTINIADNYHGTIVSDPYRWLEDADSPESKRWLDKQSRLTVDTLSENNFRESIYKDLKGLWNYNKPYLSLPFGEDIAPQKVGEYYYYFKNSGTQHQPILYRAKELDGSKKEEVVIDVNYINEKGTTSISNIAFDSKNEQLAYALSVDGSDWQEIKILNLRTKKNYNEVIKWCKFSTISWDKNGEGFYYNRYPKPANMNSKDCHYNNKVYWHRVGTSQSEDLLVYESDDNELAFHPVISGDNNYLILHANRDFNNKNQIYYKELKSNESFKPLFSKEDSLYKFIGNDGKNFYIYTNYKSPKGRIVKVDINNPNPRNWKAVVEEIDDTIVSIKLANNHFIVCYLHNASHKLMIYNLDGILKGEIPIPKHGSVTSVTWSQNSKELFIGYTSFLHPTNIYKYSFNDNSLKEVFNVKFKGELSNFEVRQFYYSSKDGTSVPIYLVHKKGIKKNAENPVILNGYGGFNRARTPSFSPSQIMWMEDGGIYALANIRGGAEYGEEWHQGGMRKNKQNVFDDFITAAEWLIDQRYTKASKLAISGRSNGGLLVAACMLQRSDLFGAVICEVPVIDMLRFQEFTIGRFWKSEFGSITEGKDSFDNLYAYSPLHNVKKDVSYPPILITSGDTDTRVDPMHAKKFTATLQASHIGDNPVLLRMDKNAGHGFGKPIEKSIEEQTDIYTFLYNSLNVKK